VYADERRRSGDPIARPRCGLAAATDRDDARHENARRVRHCIIVSLLLLATRGRRKGQRERDNCGAGLRETHRKPKGNRWESPLRALHRHTAVESDVGTMSSSTLADFELLEQLGKGSFGVVFKVRRKGEHRTPGGAEGPLWCALRDSSLTIHALHCPTVLSACVLRSQSTAIVGLTLLGLRFALVARDGSARGRAQDVVIDEITCVHRA
jgi:hypothetical protein